MAVVAELDADHAMTERLVRRMGRQSLEYTYAEMAKQVGVDEKTVRNVFDAYVVELEKKFQREAPVWLGVDEIKLGRFRAIFPTLAIPYAAFLQRELQAMCIFFLFLEKVLRQYYSAQAGELPEPSQKTCLTQLRLD